MNELQTELSKLFNFEEFVKDYNEYFEAKKDKTYIRRRNTNPKAKRKH